MRRIFTYLFIAFFSIVTLLIPLQLTEVYAAPAVEETETVYLNFFYSLTCPHCAEEAPFVEELAANYERVELRAFEVSQNRSNAVLLGELAQKLETPVGGVPFTVIGTEAFIGYQDDQTTGQEISQVVEACLVEFNESCQDQLGPLLTDRDGVEQADQHQAESTPTVDKNDTTPDENQIELDKELELPFVGQVKVKDLSLPLLTFLVALLDGFNPCAMWVLVFLISLLLGMKDRRRMWLLGFTFIFSSAAVYFLFLSAWLNLFLFLGFVFWVRLVVALIALGAGIYCLYDFATNKNAACKVTQPKKRKKVFAQLKILVKKDNIWLALIGIALLAAAVNLIELVCSAGLPAVFTQVLSLSNLPLWQYYAYLVFYVLVFMLDDLLVFIAAMVTLRLTGLENRYARFSRLIGGIIMLIIGLMLIFKPEWLMFA